MHRISLSIKTRFPKCIASLGDGIYDMKYRNFSRNNPKFNRKDRLSEDLSKIDFFYSMQNFVYT
ncbi:hypothetical protein LEP1GSC058_0254 [Leptospira fainei serovar Hurstbridge str. BUT 6]|uniref:Uncharacterized protein n=1 Tax=Leptospira fainei serovar Hurstbridge str. BUT 6 TaxID=1193011 RepID=S3V7R7_9LEPT|nr:hypothetical protein LEP1GSC058_0254 [Leptospira fainei serovar Hurstbridge str. BUT 6]